VSKRVDAILTSADALFNSGRERIIALASQYRLPTVYVSIDAVRAGGLMSYNPSTADAYRQAGVYAGRVLRGEKPSDLPVLLPTKFEFALNLKAAKEIGLDVPDRMLALADEVIE
jgi:putative tryptophan/tyrosine transport system substrate-binding protein